MQWLVWIGSHNLNGELEIIDKLFLEVNFQPCTGYYVSDWFFRLIGQVNLLYNFWTNMIKKTRLQKE